ncbi:MAG: GH92 family glycosyl hydrolase [Bacteroidota bacterium]|nr:GH92 family glycosyl hydrolase [Bacteroidota bacterium]MDP4194975.1 GH92 family glycosyl hydrolase [Bacteroidota bacterium]
MKAQIIILIYILLALSILTLDNHYAQGSANKKIDLIQYVNPLIGTAPSNTISARKHGKGTELNAQVQPSVTIPFGMTNWTAQTHNSEKKCLSSYYYKDSLITGFRGSHWLSGSCTQEYGSMAVMPISGKLVCNPFRRGSQFTHAKEISSPDYYKVSLDKYDITAEISATARCGILRFTFNKAGEAHIIVNPNNEKKEGYVRVIPEKGEIVGYNPIRRIYQGWGKPAGFSGNFVVRIEKAAKGYGVYSADETLPKQTVMEKKNDIGAYFSFKVKKGEQIIVKIGTSFVSIDQARKNLDSEIPGYDFNSVRSSLKEVWNELLSKILVEGESNDDKVKFYTAMYHSFQQPRIYNDVDGTYPRFNGNSKTDTIKDGNYYCDFSIWDTYRALHPLYNILIPKENADMMRSLLLMGKAGGWLPIFPKWNSYTSAMIGDHAISLIAEAYIKGNISLSEDDYMLLKHNATETPSKFEEYADGKGRRALTSYLKYGYIPLEDSVKEAFHNNEQVSRTLEYAYDDFSLAQVAKKMGKEEDYRYFFNRSKNYRNVYDTTIHNMNGRYKDGSFIKNTDKEDFASFITEGTPWQYNWYVPQDVKGLIELMGGMTSFNDNLDKFFEAGQYWHGNEPSHQIAFLYNYSSEPWKTQQKVNNILKEEYDLGPGGLSGNDDSGQMSAWYVLGAIGFYPVCPVLPEYQISGPKFRKVTLTCGNGNTFIINAPNYSSNNYFIHGIELNGRKYDGFSLSHDQLMKGGEMKFDMSSWK